MSCLSVCLSVCLSLSLSLTHTHTHTHIHTLTPLLVPSQVTDQVENIVENLSAAREQLDNAEPVSAHPDKLRDQLADNSALIEDLDKRLAALDAVRATAEELAAQQGMDDIATRGQSRDFRFRHVAARSQKRLKRVLTKTDSGTIALKGPCFKTCQVVFE